MKRLVIIENLLIVLLALVITWLITAFAYQKILVNSKQSDLKTILYSANSFTQSGVIAEKKLKASGKPDIHISIYENSNAENLPKEVSSAFKNGYGENIDDISYLGTSRIRAAQKFSDGSVLQLSADVPYAGFTAFGILPALLAAFAILFRFSSTLITNIKFVFKGVAMTLERAGNEGGVTVKPAPELLEYDDFSEESAEIAQLSTQVSHKVRDLFMENKRIDYLLNNMNEGLVVFDRNLNILTINRSAILFFDAAFELKGQNILRLTHNPAVAEKLKEVAESGSPASVDISPDGQKTLQILMSAVRDEDEKLDGAIMLISDVSKIRLAEKIRSEFVANASHELKTPLTSIKGFSELIDSGIIKDPEKVSGYLEHIRTETERMIGLINDILKLSELESSAFDTGKVQVSLKLIAQKVCDSLINQINSKGVTVSVSGDIGSIEANPDQMKQMFLNLIDNAIKYNKPLGSVDVTVEQASEFVLITVKDTGVGIPEESQKRVFERFYRVDKSRSRKLGGTGLGLSIVKHIVGLYKGSIRLESKVGVGTSIEITLPFAE